ncbi:MAG: 3-deoxy-manno-octulosonate cytidylyltransferase [Legionellales bacterium RIFCSPHIGHO2_12_FULL_35_11]|nr:MAG: 3-deoxy-manno-octulosonate cytidylyltransferase [Legionellales bacterium RIFCSPHIGHO2_12_FULL_35_11]
MKSVIVIPARYQSTRLPGKPLALINGKTMLERVVRISESVAAKVKNVSVLVATDDERILKHCDLLAVASIFTSPDLLTGTDRVAEAIRLSGDNPDFILNMQGDAPLTPPDFLIDMINAFGNQPCDVITPVTRLTWDELDKLRNSKLTTPFSGTTAVFNEETGRAYWFSKNIIPAIRKEIGLRNNSGKSPVYRHIGLYGYSKMMLMKYSTLKENFYENLEGLEQLRLLEQGYDIRCVTVDYKGRANMSGVDSYEDITRAEMLIQKHGELI